MKILTLILCTFVVFETAVNAWTESEACDGHDGDSVNRRRLAIKAAVERETGNRHTGNKENKSLRGYRHRNLGTEPTIETFQLKMHWEEGYCWQLEDFDRRWCISCYGGTCGEGDLLWIQECNDALIQRFVWESIPITGRTDTGKLKPYLNQDLCLEYVGTNGTYSHFGVTNPRWWYFLLQECELGNDLQILEGHFGNDPFDIVARDETLTDERLLTQAHDPRAGEIILGEARHVAEFDFTSLWEKHNVEDLPEIPESSGSSLFCPPWPLMKTDAEEWEIVRSNDTIVNWEADTFVEQYNNGRFVVRRGFPDRKESILFDNELDLPEDDYFTKLRGNGDLITFRGTPDDPKGDSVWKIDNDRPEGQYFLGVECDLGTVSIYEYVPEDPGERLWTTEGTDWVPDLTTKPPTPAPTLPVSTTTDPEDTTDQTSATIQSVDATVEPDTTIGEPTSTTTEPVTETDQPEAITTATAAPTLPVSTTTDPEDTTDETSTTTQSVDATVEPDTTNAEPTSTTTEPVTEIDEPEATTSATETETTSTPVTPSPSPSTNIAPEVVAVSGSFCTPTSPCPMCYGDCDEDSDCQGELICEQRDDNAAVSGCTGGESSTSSTDYCVDPNAVGVGSLTPRSSPSPVPSPSAIPLPVLAFSDSCSPTSPCNKCIGDCDADSDCIGLLVCKERDGGEPVEGCSGSSDSKTDFCVDP